MSLLVPVRRNRALAWPAFNDLEQQLERVFNAKRETNAPLSGAWAPAVDIHETDDAYNLEADLPGLTREEIEVKVIEDRVTIRGTRKQENSKEEKGILHRERIQGAFERSFRLRGGIDGSKVEAHFENGVLSVKLPKPEETKPRQIEVKIT